VAVVEEQGLSIYEEKIDGVPQFVSYFAPVLEIVRDLGGQARPRQVFDALVERYNLPASFLEQTNQNGRPTFENRVAFARFYLTKAGLLTSPKRGTWALTAAGRHAELSPDDAAELYRSTRSSFDGDEDEDQPPGEEAASDGVSYWFVGAMWDKDDQTERFLTEGIWQNRQEDKLSKLVRQMQPGDRIAIKATYVRKRDVPFDNRGRPVSAMKIKAIGTITANRDDGLTVEVDWTEVDPPREWYFYTFRTTVVRARFEDEVMARQLVAFTFDEADQNFPRFLAHPYWAARYAAEAEPLSVIEDEEQAETDDEMPAVIETYGIADIIAEGGFLGQEALAGLIERLGSKKNLILQGPPGTGKTWLAKRLAKALIGRKSPRADQLRSVQFHPSLSYEDFVRGYRPTANGLALTDGVFLQVVEAARAQPDLPHVLIIEEINRGNPAQVFGELLTLLENTKRSRAEAMELAYRRQPGERVHVPDNLYVIGTMNIADRSLALVDLALRRRFAFVSLEPALNDAWADWCRAYGMDAETIASVRDRLQALNTTIADDRALGPQFRVGHSFVTPTEDVTDARQWFREIVATEIGPLLEEYWFDTPERAKDATARLLAAL
jgi:5-methylcytosine-specific restriction enzyme B